MYPKVEGLVRGAGRIGERGGQRGLMRGGGVDLAREDQRSQGWVSSNELTKATPLRTALPAGLVGLKGLRRTLDVDTALVEPERRVAVGH